MQYFFLIKRCHKSRTHRTESCSQIVATLMCNKLLQNGSILRVICGRFKNFFLLVCSTSADQGKLEALYRQLGLENCRQARLIDSVE